MSRSSATLQLCFLLCTVLSTLISFARGVPSNTNQAGVLAIRDPDYETKAGRILKDTPLIDGHNDLAYFLRWAYNDHIYFDNFTQPFENGTLGGEVDLARLKKGQVGGTFWAVYGECPPNSTYSPAYFAESLAKANAAVDVLHRIAEKYSDSFGIARNSGEAAEIFKSGRIISPIGLESLHLIGDSFARLRDYHARGVRYATLTHNCHNIYADAAQEELSDGSTIVATPLHHGVSPVGQKIIKEINRLGIIADLSHTSMDTQRNVLGAPALNSTAPWNGWEGSLAPPIFSHSSAYTLCPHPRNVPDDVLHLVQKRRGLVMINFYPGFISCYWPNGTAIPGGFPTLYEGNATIARVVEHMRYIGDLIGYSHVGIGSDFDGTPTAPRGLEDVAKYPDLVVEMLRQGIEEGDVKKIIGENLLRVWREVDEVAERLRREGVTPKEDELPSLPNPWIGAVQRRDDSGGLQSLEMVGSVFKRIEKGHRGCDA